MLKLKHGSAFNDGMRTSRGWERVRTRERDREIERKRERERQRERGRERKKRDIEQNQFKMNPQEAIGLQSTHIILKLKASKSYFIHQQQRQKAMELTDTTQQLTSSVCHAKGLRAHFVAPSSGHETARVKCVYTSMCVCVCACVC